MNKYQIERITERLMVHDKLDGILHRDQSGGYIVRAEPKVRGESRTYTVLWWPRTAPVHHMGGFESRSEASKAADHMGSCYAPELPGSVGVDGVEA
jgi:hypothetical protein